MTNLLKGFIYHNLYGINGWSIKQNSNLDVAKIIDIYHHKRLFCLLDRDHKYTLNIIYSEISVSNSISPVVTTNGIGAAVFVPRIDTEYIITKRYKTEQECIGEITNINNKINKIKNYMDKIKKRNK
jgi:hypothetical protein